MKFHKLKPYDETMHGRGLQWATRWGHTLHDGFLYHMDGLSPDGGYFMLFVPCYADHHAITAAIDALREKQDVIGITLIALPRRAAA